MFRKIIAVCTLATFVFYTSLAGLAAQNAQNKDTKSLKENPPTFEEIFKNYSFIETANLSEIVPYSVKDIEAEQKKLDQKEKDEQASRANEYSTAKVNLKTKQKELSDLSKKIETTERKYRSQETVMEEGKPKKVPKIDYEGLGQDAEYKNLQEERKALVCQVREWEAKADKNVYKARQRSTHTFYEVVGTQLDLLKNWPQEAQKIEEQRKSGVYEERKFPNPQDIGLRDLGFGDAAEDSKYLQYPEIQRIIEENYRKHEYQNPKIKSYVVGLIQTVVANSDLKMPIEDKNIIVIDNDDINASAFIGGVIIVNKGLLKFADSEADLMGVFSHEISHLAARHAHRLNKKATVAGILFQAAELAAILATGGIASYGMYYLFQGVESLANFLIELKFLGVTRGYELEADTLGIQYMWKMGYDPMSFMNLFEKMGRDKGNVRNTSFFYTHPAFSERIAGANKETRFLPPSPDDSARIINTTAFMEMQARICVDEEVERAEDQELKKNQYRPTLRRGEQKEKERADKDCGPVKPTEEKKKTCCDDPKLEEFKVKIREEVAQEKSKPEKTGIELKRPGLKKPEHQVPPPDNK